MIKLTPAIILILLLFGFQKGFTQINHLEPLETELRFGGGIPYHSEYQIVYNYLIKDMGLFNSRLILRPSSLPDIVLQFEWNHSDDGFAQISMKMSNMKLGLMTDYSAIKVTDYIRKIEHANFFEIQSIVEHYTQNTHYRKNDNQLSNGRGTELIFLSANPQRVGRVFKNEATGSLKQFVLIIEDLVELILDTRTSNNVLVLPKELKSRITSLYTSIQN